MNDLKIKQYLTDQAMLEEYLDYVFKDPIRMGIFYERYIGYIYEKEGYSVEYSGLRKGLEDQGRDLIAKKGKDVLVIQCKNWSRSVVIHAKHIYQLYGTSSHFQKQSNSNVKAIFVSTGELSSNAQAAAIDLGVEIRLIALKRDYPLVKCNVNHLGKLYHLPFGKFYDKVHINPKSGDCFVHSVEEAVKRGFCTPYHYKKRSA